jgi:putative endonuclease
MTNNLERRLEEHFRGNSKTTSKYLPLKLVFVQICESRLEARKLEKYLKSGIW